VGSAILDFQEIAVLMGKKKVLWTRFTSGVHMDYNKNLQWCQLTKFPVMKIYTCKNKLFCPHFVL